MAIVIFHQADLAKSTSCCGRSRPSQPRVTGCSQNTDRRREARRAGSPHHQSSGPLHGQTPPTGGIRRSFTGPQSHRMRRLGHGAEGLERLRDRVTVFADGATSVTAGAVTPQLGALDPGNRARPAEVVGVGHEAPRRHGLPRFGFGDRAREATELGTEGADLQGTPQRGQGARHDAAPPSTAAKRRVANSLQAASWGDAAAVPGAYRVTPSGRRSQTSSSSCTVSNQSRSR